MRIPPLNILGVPVAPIDLDIAAKFLLDAAENRRKGWVCVVSVHGVVESHYNNKFCEALKSALLNTTDGIPLVWYGRSKGHPKMQRVYGPDLMLKMMEVTRDGKFGHYLFGGAPGIADQLKEKLEAKFPGVRIVGTFTPPYRPLNPAEVEDLNAKLDETRPHFFWVGLGTPKQEIFMKDHCEILNAGIMFGVGAAFDFHSGHLKQAPLWLRQRGLEWLFRLTQEPVRLWKRYIVIVPLFALHTLLELLGIKKYPPIRTEDFS